MPSNYTQNYNLNQWSASDRVQRSDFNADNAKIDAALKAEADARAAAVSTLNNRITAVDTKSRFTKLWETTTTADGTIEIDMTGIDWSKWDKVHLEYEAAVFAEVQLRLNDVTQNQYISFYGQVNSFLSRFTMMPGFQPTRMGYIIFNNTQYHFVGRYIDFNKLILTNGKAGAHISLWGEV